jgi:protein-L-isoaspartate(D-aspartate) O-methyltransferase
MVRKTKDEYKHKGLRRQLVETLKEKGITDEHVLRAIGNIPRHFFLDIGLDIIAYEDRAFPIGEGQTISQPYTVAYQTQLLQVRPHDKILEIGTGSAYQAVVLAEMGAEVFSIERQKKLAELNNKFLYLRQFPNLHLFFGDGFEGMPAVAPFDKVIITAAAPYVPPKLIDQLKPGGVMVIPVEEKEVQRMKRITKTNTGDITEELFEEFSFVPMLGYTSQRPS